MADLKISQLTAISVLTPATDVLPVVDVGGVTKKITTNQILGSGGTATLASATITGDLTVDTSTLKVDSTNDRVGIGTASPAAGAKLGVTGATVVSTSDYIGSSTWAARFTGSSNGASSGISFLTNSSGGYPAPASIHATPIADYRSALVATYSADSSGAGYFAVNRSSPIGANTLEHYKIDNAGVATWSNVGGVAGTAMTLNSTGLGIGVSPSYQLDVLGSSNSGILGVTCSSQVSSIRLRQTAVINVATRNWEINTNSTAYGNLEFRVGASAQSDTYSTAVTFDSSANIFAKGIAGTSLVTVAALSTNYALPIGAFAGLIVIRSNGGGGSAVFMLDPNAGAVSISNNIVGRTITLTYSGGAWQFQQTVGAVTSTYNYLLLATQ